MNVLKVSFILIASSSADPCTQLCAFDTDNCTKGSWTEKGVCRHYLYLGPKSEGNYCYHVEETRERCPSSGEPVLPVEVQGLITRKQSMTSTVTTTATPTTSTREDIQPASRADPNRQSNAVPPSRAIRGSSSRRSFESIVVPPTSGHHKATIFLLHGVNSSPEGMMRMGQDTWMRSITNAKFISVGAPGGSWFPFVGPIVDRNVLNANMEILRNMIDHEASLLPGGLSKVFLIGYSQGGMMSVWTALMGGQRLGGVAMINSAVPVMDIGTIQPEGRDVPIVHYHGLQDSILPIHVARLGRANAIAAGVRFYDLVEQPGSHDASTAVTRSVTDWLRERI
jgi:predicted esterase